MTDDWIISAAPPDPTPTEVKLAGGDLHVTALCVDTSQFPTFGYQWAVKATGRYIVYGDQRWVASGEAAEDTGRGTSTVRRTVRIEYGGWEVEG